MHTLSDKDVIDLISERHVMLRKICETLWNEHNELPISNSEWYIMARIYNETSTVSGVAKQVDITRQAAHKLIKKMESKGLVEFANSHNNRDKCIQLTESGEQYYEKYRLMKASLEEKIAEKIGAEQLAHLRKLLLVDWEIR